MEQLIFQGHVREHPVVITDEGSLRSLRFGTEERQSCLDLFQPQVLQLAYTRWMVTALLLHPQPERFLVVGLGGGALVHFLLHHFPEGRITVVEKERLVVELAHGYFGVPITRRLRVCHGDALEFGRAEPPVGYHVAFLDIFAAGAMAPALYDIALYHQLLQQLDPEGILAVNLWSGDRRLYRRALEVAEEASQGRMLQMQVKKRSNVILLLFPGAIPHRRIKMARKHGPLFQQHYGLDFPQFLNRFCRTNRSSLLRTLFG